MKCLSRQRMTEQKDLPTIKRIARMAAEKQLDDVYIRTQNIIYMAMLDSGLSEKTVKKVQNAVKNIEKEYGEDRKFSDSCKQFSKFDTAVADEKLYRRLTDRGVNVEKPSKML